MKDIGIVVLALFLVACTHVNGGAQTSTTENSEVELEQELNEIDDFEEDLDGSEFQELEGKLDNL